MKDILATHICKDKELHIVVTKEIEEVYVIKEGKTYKFKIKTPSSATNRCFYFVDGSLLRTLCR